MIVESHEIFASEIATPFCVCMAVMLPISALMIGDFASATRQRRGAELNDALRASKEMRHWLLIDVRSSTLRFAVIQWRVGLSYLVFLSLLEFGALHLTDFADLCSVFFDVY